MDIYEELMPDIEFNTLLIDDNGLAYVNIIDSDGDPFKFEFKNDGCAYLSFEGYTYISLDADTLFLLSELVFEADEWYNSKEFKEIIADI